MDISVTLNSTQVLGSAWLLFIWTWAMYGLGSTRKWETLIIPSLLTFGLILFTIAYVTLPQ